MSELSTFGALEQRLNGTQVADTTANDKPSDTTVNNDGQLQNTSQPDINSTTHPPDVTTPTNVAATSDTPAAEPDISSSSFDIGAPAQSQDGIAAQPATSQTAPSYNWKEEIKKLPKDELLKELGVDPFAIEIDSHIKGGGQPLDYLQARAIDYNKISDEALLKDDLRKKYPNLQPSQIDLMYDRKYAPLSDLSDDKEFAEAQLQADAYNVRQAKIAEQQKFKIADVPVAQKDEAYEQYKQARIQQEQIGQQLKEFYSNHADTRKLNETKRVSVSLGEGIPAYNFNVSNPDVITNSFVDGGETLNRLMTTQSGEPDVAKQQIISLFAHNPQKFASDVFNYGRAFEKRQRLAEGQNAQLPNRTTGGDNQQQKFEVKGFNTFGKMFPNQ